MRNKKRQTNPRQKTQIGTPHLGQFLRDLAGFSYRVPRRLLTQWRGEQGGKVMVQFLRTKAQAASVADRQAEALAARRRHFAEVAARRRALDELEEGAA
jgi:hypothetical protein